MHPRGHETHKTPGSEIRHPAPSKTRGATRADHTSGWGMWWAWHLLLLLLLLLWAIEMWEISAHFRIFGISRDLLLLRLLLPGATI